MAGASRAKGLKGEREVADRFEAAGFAVRGLEGQGDWLCVAPPARSLPLLHVECKRQERLRLPEWIEQAASEAPAGSVPVVCFRQNRGQWRADLALDDLLRLIA